MLMNLVTVQSGREHVFTLRTFVTTVLKFSSPHGDLLDASQNWIQEYKLKNIDIDNKYHFIHLKDPFQFEFSFN